MCLGANDLVVTCSSCEDISVQRNAQSDQCKGKYNQNEVKITQKQLK